MRNQIENDHLSPEDFYHFIDEDLDDCTRESVERHLVGCEGFLETLALIVRAEAPPTPEEEALLKKRPGKSQKEMLERLRPVIAGTMLTR